MVTVKEITDFLYTISPVYLAEDYDNVGLLVESESEKIESVLLSLDTDVKVAEEAKEIPSPDKIRPFSQMKKSLFLPCFPNL